MERPKWDEEQILKQKEMIKERDVQFANLYREVIKNRKDIKKCAELIAEISKVIKRKDK
jgi:hypothetical protein